jgi:hypothetical protein
VKILVVCHHGNNRSVNFAHRIKYIGHDVLTAGLKTNSTDTLRLLYEWADSIIITEESQEIPDEYFEKVTLFDVGPDTYPRPFNPELDGKVKEIIKQNRAWLGTHIEKINLGD